MLNFETQELKFQLAKKDKQLREGQETIDELSKLLKRNQGSVGTQETTNTPKIISSKRAINQGKPHN